jgi:hypothetical protein
MAAAKKRTKARVSDEYFAITEEIVKEAFEECMVEMQRRGLDTRMALITTAIEFFTRGVNITQKLHAETGSVHASKEALHARLDEVWEALRTPDGVDDKVH